MYLVDAMSDGEKTVLYYIITAILIKPYSILVVDEPTTHLHSSLMGITWDIVEEILEKNNVTLVYITHNIDFAISRRDIEYLSIKEYSPLKGATFEKISNIGCDINSKTIIELSTINQYMIFCEGSKDSLDYKLYSLIFPDFHIVPSNGKDDIRQILKLFKKSELKKYYGIVDGDFIAKRTKINDFARNIICLPVTDIEALYLHKSLITNVIDVTLLIDNYKTIESKSLQETIKENVLDKLKNRIDKCQKEKKTFDNIKVDKIYNDETDKAKNNIKNKLEKESDPHNQILFHIYTKAGAFDFMKCFQNDSSFINNIENILEKTSPKANVKKELNKVFHDFKDIQNPNKGIYKDFIDRILNYEKQDNQIFSDYIKNQFNISYREHVLRFLEKDIKNGNDEIRKELERFILQYTGKEKLKE